MTNKNCNVFQQDVYDNINTYTKKIHNLSELTIGQPVVHLKHGIGRYQGLKLIEISGIETEYFIISYAESTKLYVPIYYLHLIYTYNNSLIEKNAPLHKLGGDLWIKEREKISKKIYDTATELLRIYAIRASNKGFAFQQHKEQYEKFSNKFPYKTTADQDLVINSVLHDMSLPTPMDRLICGDVGFGKTEVAMRAAFLATLNKKQVLLLAPTTLLVQQHYNNFKNRFVEWPVNIKLLSRFCTVKEQSLITNLVQKGKINILIGSHQVLFKKIKWKDLGLLIIDEEHRFGVKHKEHIKQEHSSIDVLTLTATPIPRTLNMSMLGIRDLSIITTPPEERIAVKTYVCEYNAQLIKHNIIKELSRGGQIYYICNEVKTINKVALYLSQLVPEANIQVGHGQMSTKTLKQIINDFYHKRFNVLVCTTIIESGIDIPTVNTIFIENANCFGLAQLHQLRGRVGRSNVQAYAWLIVNNFNKLSHSSKKRLEAISSNTNFGSGLKLATNDLEIRGIGELLGQEQSGHIKNIGFPLYMKFLKIAIQQIKNQKSDSLLSILKYDPEIKLNISAILPLSYIKSAHIRLYFYMLLSNAKNNKDIFSIKIKLLNQFGIIPNKTKNLLKLTKIQLMAKHIGIKTIKINKKGGLIKFDKNHCINLDALMNIIRNEPKKWKIVDHCTLKIIRDLLQENDRINWVFYMMKKLERI
ncbi:transcription-repair coupling factor [Buchnera aphidicola (Hormaphis cornu)]|nr:transcription-repair coupling factor [Buchnera aphidicola (Hormaphis cornu)]